MDLPASKTETVRILNDNVRLLLDGVMRYQLAPIPPNDAVQGTITTTGCTQKDKDFLEGPPWQYSFTTGDAYSIEKEQALEQRIHQLTAAGWRVIRSPESNTQGRWTIAQDQGFLLTAELPTGNDKTAQPPEDLRIVVSSTSPCVDVDDNS